MSPRQITSDFDDDFSFILPFDDLYYQSEQNFANISEKQPPRQLKCVGKQLERLRKSKLEKDELNAFIEREAKRTFVWDEEACTEFCKLAAKMGVNNLKPKRLLTYFPRKYKATAVQLGSHLQKYRNKIIRDYGLQSPSQIQNWMVPVEYQQNQMIQELADKWR